MISFSAKDLCTRSCMQIRFFNENPDKRPKPNVNTIFGESFQHKVAETTKEVIGEEMRGTYIKDNICINFSNDIVTKNSIIECKSINREVEEWYFESSLVQCAVYSSLLQKTNGDLVTSKFFSDMGNPIIKTTVDKNIDYLLRFGENTYKVTVNDADKIVDFMLKKAKATYTYNEEKTFDLCYKQKEYETLKQYFNYNRIEIYE